MKQNSINSKNILRGVSATKTFTNKERKLVIKNQILEAKKEAKKIISEAEEYAEQVRVLAEEKAEKKLKEAFDVGSENALMEMEKNLLDSREIREKIFRETEKDILKLSIKLAEKIVGREIEENKQTINDIVSNALQNARQQERITIRVNPNDLQIVQKKADDFKSFSQTKYLDCIADPRVEKGGCLIESEVGTVDARLETQFRVLERAMLAQADGEFVKDSL